MAIPGDALIYRHPDGKGYGEQAKGDALSAEMSELDLKDGQTVTFLDYDEDSMWPIIEWTDAVGINRITTIDPSLFDNSFDTV